MTDTGIGNHILEALHRQYVLRKNDIGSDAHLKAKGIRLNTETWEIEGIGHLCILKMHAFFGLVTMETAVLSVTHKDVPIFNADSMKFIGSQTQIIELYDNQLSQWPLEDRKAFLALRDRDSDLPDYESGEHWYSSILFPCSYAKRAKDCSERFDSAAKDYIDTFVRQLKNAEDCPVSEKSAKTAAFADQLITQGGPAADNVVKLFGEETAHRLIRKHMYGV